MTSNIDDLISCCPCLACGALPGEFCVTLYSKTGEEGGRPFPGHHMVRCFLWYKLCELRGKKTYNGTKLNRGTVAGCYYDIVRIDYDKKREEHRDSGGKLIEQIKSDNLKRAMSRF